MLLLLRQRRFGIALFALTTVLGGLLPLAQRVCAMEMPAMEMMEAMEDCCCSDEAHPFTAPLPAPAVHTHLDGESCADGLCFDAGAAAPTPTPQATVEAPPPRPVPLLVCPLYPPDAPARVGFQAPPRTGPPPMPSVDRPLLFSTLLC